MDSNMSTCVLIAVNYTQVKSIITPILYCTYYFYSGVINTKVSVKTCLFSDVVNSFRRATCASYTFSVKLIKNRQCLTPSLDFGCKLNPNQ